MAQPSLGPAERTQPAWGWVQGGLAAGELRELGPFHQAECSNLLPATCPLCDPGRARSPLWAAVLTPKAG